MNAKLTSAELLDRLRARYRAPEHALFTEVADATGGRASRRADAIAMGLWPSRGLELEGFEIKVSRADWLRERKDPAKAEKFVRFCDRWWVVASETPLIVDGELPPTWGLLVAHGPGLRVVRDAPKLEPEPVTRLFLAALLRRVHEASPSEAEIAAAMQRGRSDAEAAAKRRADERVRTETELARREVEAARRTLAIIEETCGMRAESWNAKRIGEAMRLAYELGPDKLRQNLETVRDHARTIAADIDRRLAETAAGEAASS